MVEPRLGRDVTASVGYVGQFATHLVVPVNANQAPRPGEPRPFDSVYPQISSADGRNVRKLRCRSGPRTGAQRGRSFARKDAGVRRPAGDRDSRGRLQRVQQAGFQRARSLDHEQHIWKRRVGAAVARTSALCEAEVLRRVTFLCGHNSIDAMHALTLTSVARKPARAFGTLLTKDVMPATSAGASRESARGGCGLAVRAPRPVRA